MSDTPDMPADPASPPPDESAPRPDAAVTARDLLLRGDRGVVYGPLDLDLPTGGVTALIGPEGSGRTCLLLTLAGRMAPSQGRLEVLGHRLPKGRRDLHRTSALAHIGGIDDLDEGLTVHEVLSERAGLLAPLWRRPQATDDAGIRAICQPLFGARPIPPANEQLWHLPAVDLTLLQISQALMGDPRLLVVDDVDGLTDPDDQRAVWSGLLRVAVARGTTVVGVTTTIDALPAGVRAVSLSSADDIPDSPAHTL